MSEDNTTTTDPEGSAPQDGDRQSKPPWGDDFDPEKAWKLVENLRADNKARTSAEVAKLQKQIADLKPLADEAQALKDAKKSDVERLTEQLTALQSSVRDARTQALRGEIKALAAKEFADPEDAAAFLDPSKYLNDNGQYDEAAVKADLEDLLKRKPHLAREAPRTPRTPAPDRTQGSSGGAKNPASPRDSFAAWMQRNRGASA
jgi:hypothetical protein